MKKNTGNTALVTASDGPPAPQDAAIDKVVHALTNLKRTAGLDLANAVGKLIIDGLYSGDLTKWRDRGPKETSFRKLAQRDDLPMSPSAVYQSVAVYELVQRLGLTSPQHLALSHLRLVLGLPEKQQAHLLDKAERDGWSITRLENEAQKHRRDGRGGGRPVIPLFVKALHAWTRVAGQDDLYDEGHIANLKPEQLADARQAVAAMQRQLAVLAARLGTKAVPDALAEPPVAEPAPEARPEPSAKGRRRGAKSASA